MESKLFSMTRLEEVSRYVEERVLLERERCAKIAESMHGKTYWDDPSAGIAATIRKTEVEK